MVVTSRKHTPIGRAPKRLGQRRSDLFALQMLLFPDGLTFDGKGFGTGTISPVFKVLEPSTNVKGSMASPITPGWNQVVGWPREVQRIREIAGDVAA